MVIPHYLGTKKDMESESKNIDNHVGMKREDSFSSSQDVPLLSPEDSRGMDTPVGDTALNELSSFLHRLNQPTKVNSSRPFSFRKAKIEPIGSDTPMKGFVDDLDPVDHHGKMPMDRATLISARNSVPEWWETQERGDQGSFADESGQVGPRVSCRCQVWCFHSVQVSNIDVSMSLHVSSLSYIYIISTRASYI